jgi:hypothetical protein
MAPVLARLDEIREFGERHSPAGLVVGDGYAPRQTVVHGEDIGAAVRLGERDRDRHLAAKPSTA